MAYKTQKPSIAIYDDIIKKILRGYSKQEVMSQLNLSKNDFDHYLRSIEKKYAIDLEALNKSLGQRVP